jgi:hypothetical protein
MDKKLLDLYSDYLLASCGPVTATGLSSLVEGRLSHDQITRFLSGPALTAKKSLKQNASAAKSPTRTLATQTNHLFCCLHAFVKLERIQAAATLNHFAIKARIYHAGLKKMFNCLRSLPSASLNTLATA